MLDCIVEKNYVRELNIIKKLIDENDWVDIDELSELNKVVPRTVIQDIDRVKRNLPKEWDIVLKNNRVKIYKSSHSNYLQIFRIYLKKSFSYQVLTKFFLGINKSLISICNDLHISHSHFYKKIQKVQSLLPKGIHFNLEKLCLEGDEIQIRLLYFNLLSITNCISDFGFNNTSFLSIEENIKKVSKSLNIELSDIGQQYCKYWIAICYKRNKNYIDKSNLGDRNPIEVCLKKIYRNSTNLFENKLVSESHVHSLGFYFQTIRYSRKAQKEFLNFYEKNFELVPLVEGMMQVLKRNKEEENNNLKLYLIDIFIADIILKNYPYFQKYVQKSCQSRLNQELLSLLQDHFQQIERSKGVYVSYDKKERFLKGIVCFFNPLLSCFLQNEKITIVVSLSQGVEIERKIAAKINALYVRWINARSYDSLRNQSLETIDILVTDVDNVYSSRKDVLLWETPDTPLDWKNLSVEITNKLVYKLSERRNLIEQV